MIAYRIMGFEECPDGALESGYEKIAIYVSEIGEPTHIARQLGNGSWTSKLGELEDIEHGSPESLEGPEPCYGSVASYMRREPGGDDS